MKTKVSISIEKIEGQGISPKQVIDGLVALKRELTALGAAVSISLDGKEVDEIQVVDMPEVQNERDSE